MVPWGTLFGAFVLYRVGLIIYRLYLSPLAKFPGPKLAAATSWYCAYHDIVRGGQYIWVIEEMHRKYGPIVRTMPGVLHVNDPAFLEKLYSQSPSTRRERAQTTLNLFQNDKSVLPTRDHDLHRRRRAIISRFFSQGNVRRLIPAINETLADLLGRLEEWSRKDEPLVIGNAYRAATKDVIQSYALGEGRKFLHMEDFNAPFFDVLSPERLTHVGVHFHWVLVVMAKLPPSIIVTLSPHVIGFITFLDGLAEQIEKIRNETEVSESKTIFHEILASNAPEVEKRTDRLVDEAMVLTIAGADTTALTMVALTYHVLADPDVYARLRAELESVMPDASQFPDPIKLDTLPYLNAVIEESLRLYPSGTHRQDRTAPDDDLVFEYPDEPDGYGSGGREGRKSLVIPAGTAVGMTAPLFNRHPAIYDDPDSFRPERYLENPRLYRRHLTFSKGARQCLGMSLAYQELQTFTAGLFRRYGVYDPQLGPGRQAGPTMELFETGIGDVKMWADFVTPGLRPGSKGVQIKIRQD